MWGLCRCGGDENVAPPNVKRESITITSEEVFVSSTACVQLDFYIKITPPNLIE